MNGPDAKECSQSSLISAVVVAAPAVFVYFLGWSYLNYYLGAFGVGVAELDVSAETVFIYAAPAAIWLIESPSLWLVIIITVIVGVGLTHLPWRLRNQIWLVVAPIRRVLSIMPWYVRALALLVVIFIFSTLLVKLVSPVVKDAALTNAAQAWDYSGIRILATVDFSASNLVKRQLFEACTRQERLQLVFSDKSSYYMLCPSEIEADGLIYEVRRNGSVLASVRRVDKPVLGEN
ncbi:hypothetical protein H0A65_16790 [Alcaligenaceae bacterium]|nr:hypothetical protein [Alcaligenaceae bacterium]